MHQRDAFGRLITDPDLLSQPDRVDVLRRLAGQLQAAEGLEARWFGRKLLAWLQRGGDLESVIGLRPTRGSKRTAQRLIRAEQRDRLIQRLSITCGSDREALRVIKGESCGGAEALEIVADMRSLGRAPQSLAAFHRARAALNISRHHP